MRWTIKGTVHILRDSNVIIGRVLLRQDGWYAQWPEGGEVVEVGPFEEPNDARTHTRKYAQNHG